MKLKCPYCGAVFPPQDSCKCPACGKTMRIPTPYRKNPPQKKRRRFERDGAGPETSGDVFDLLKSARGIVAAVAVVAIVGGMCFTRSCGSDRNITDDNKYNVACRDLLYMGIALTNFQANTGRYPTTEEGLNALVKNPGIPGWSGPYLVTPTYNPWMDPWQNLYRYSSSNGTSVVLFTCGPDGKPDTGDERVCPHFQPTEGDRVEEALRRWKAGHPAQEPDAPKDAETAEHQGTD